MWIAIVMIAPRSYWQWGAAVAVDVLTPLFIRCSHQVRKKPQPNHPPPHLNIRVTAALLLLLLAILGGQMGVGLLLTIVALVLVVQVIIDIWLRTRNQAVDESTGKL